MLTQGEITALIDAAVDGTPMGWRDLGMLAVLFGGGLRRAEVTGLHTEDLEWSDDHVRLKVIGKRNKARIVILTGGAFAALRNWMQVRGDWPGPLFIAGHAGGHLTRRGVTNAALYAMLIKLADRAKVSRFTPHDARRSYASMALDAGADLNGLTRNLGHASPVTTMAYDRRGLRSQMKAAQSVNFPWTPEAA